MKQVVTEGLPSTIGADFVAALLAEVYQLRVLFTEE
jgi:hypothetical protein